MIPQTETPARVHVIGASGRSGAALCGALLRDGIAVVPVVRNAERWRKAGLPGAPRLADLADAAALRAALHDATHVVSCAHARHAPAVLAAAPADATFVFLGSTRKFTAWPDAHGTGVLAGEAAFLGSGRPGVMLHPTMIYGAQGENNVRRLAAWLARLPVVPLPGGGRSLVQPIHQDDVTACILAALRRRWTGPRSLVIAGPSPLTYAAFAGHVARAAGVRPPRVVGVKLGLLMAGAAVARCLPFLPRIGRAELRRLMEDKAFDVAEMRAELGVRPVGLEEGLRRMSFTTLS